MTRKHSYRTHLAALLCAGIAGILFLGCASGAGTTNSPDSVTGRENPAKKEKPKAPSLAVQSPQEAIYNGNPRPISFSYTGEDIPDIIYYPSQRALEEERGGSYTAPTLTGVYYVLVRCVYEEAHVEYRILKSPVRIRAADFQEAVFNGNPRRVQAESDPPVPLSYSYYPNRELRDAAIKAEEKAALNRVELEEIFKGYRRVERAPAEQGTYYVWIYFPGDRNHEAAQLNIEFTILPAPTSVPRQR